jgi:membrane associated rhomboid family serine protease
MARGYPEAPSMGLPRPGRALTAVLVGLLAIWLAFAVGINWGGAPEAVFTALCGSTAQILQGEVWRLFTAPLLHVPSGTVGHILFTLLGLYFLSPSLEREWGPKRFLRFLAGSAIFAYAFQMLVELVLPATLGQKLVPSLWFGAGPVVSAVSIAWALTFRGRTIHLMFVIPVTTRGLLIFVILMNVMVLIAQVTAPEGLIAPFGGMLAGWLFGSGSPSPLRRAWLKLRLAQLDAEARREADARKKRVQRSGLQVLEGGRNRDSDDDDPKKPPGGWLN